MLQHGFSSKSKIELLERELLLICLKLRHLVILLLLTLEVNSLYRYFAFSESLINIITLSR